LYEPTTKPIGVDDFFVDFSFFVGFVGDGLPRRAARSNAS
jgi:hypothetical protein